MQLGPSIWGPHLWKALHMISLGYPNEPNEEQKKNYRTFFENFCKDRLRIRIRKIRNEISILKIDTW